MSQLSLYQKLRMRLSHCPNCGGRYVRIIYGLPAPSAMEKAREGKLVLGGCCMLPDSPIGKCSKCNTYLNRDFTTESVPELDIKEYLEDMRKRH